MKRLALLRHAKAKPPTFAVADLERPLTERGEKDAPLMGKRLRIRKSRPALILTSPAQRALATARLVADALGYPREFLQREPALYMAKPEEILTVLAEQDDAFFEIMIVGHNPGLTDLVNRLLPELRLDSLPTAGVVIIDSLADRWIDVANAAAELAHFDHPRNPELLVIED
jgi:phosphohistidine phosphatase